MVNLRNGKFEGKKGSTSLEKRTHLYKEVNLSGICELALAFRQKFLYVSDHAQIFTMKLHHKNHTWK